MRGATLNGEPIRPSMVTYYVAACCYSYAEWGVDVVGRVEREIERTGAWNWVRYDRSRETIISRLGVDGGEVTGYGFRGMRGQERRLMRVSFDHARIKQHMLRGKIWAGVWGSEAWRGERYEGGELGPREVRLPTPSLSATEHWAQGEVERLIRVEGQWDLLAGADYRVRYMNMREVTQWLGLTAVR